MGYLRWVPNVTGEKLLRHDRGSNLGRLRDRPTLYHVTIKAGLYRKAVQVCYIPILGDTRIPFPWGHDDRLCLNLRLLRNQEFCLLLCKHCLHEYSISDPWKLLHQGI